MEYIKLERLGIKKVQLLRAALISYKLGIENLKEYNIDDYGTNIAIGETTELIEKLEKELDKCHADYTYKVGRAEIKPMR